MTSFIAAGGSGRSTSVIPAVPAAWSVTTIAFIRHLPVSGRRCTMRGLPGLSERRRVARRASISCLTGSLSDRGGLMQFQHADEIWRDFPELVPGVLYVTGIGRDAPADSADRAEKFLTIARARLADGPESEMPEIQAWRRAF